MSQLPLVIGAPVWDRAWSLPLWFQSVRANVEPADTGLAFVVPPQDLATRDAIAALSDGFRWVEVRADHGKQATRHERPATGHANLAAARNQILGVVERVGPERYLSWDTDFLVPAGTVEAVARRGAPLATVWAWLNRQPYRRVRWRGQDGRWVDVLVQDPGCFTAMQWWRRAPRHYPSELFLEMARDAWPTHIALAWQLMDRRAYRVARYSPHVAGEDVPFNMQLAARGVPRLCVGEILGLHLYDREAKDERALGWPGILSLTQQTPLAASWTAPRSEEMRALGLFPAKDLPREAAA